MKSRMGGRIKSEWSEMFRDVHLGRGVVVVVIIVVYMCVCGNSGGDLELECICGYFGVLGRLGEAKSQYMEVVA